jgi:hypothetical protein
MLRVLLVLVGSGRTLSLACVLDGLALALWRGPILVVAGIALILLR